MLQAKCRRSSCSKHALPWSQPACVTQIFRHGICHKVLHHLVAVKQWGVAVYTPPLVR